MGLRMEGWLNMKFMKFLHTMRSIYSPLIFSRRAWEVFNGQYEHKERLQRDRLEKKQIFSGI